MAKIADTRSVEDRMKKIIRESGGPSSLPHSILNMVCHKSYDHAKREIEVFIELKSEYPELEKVTKRYVERCQSHIDYIEENRSIPGFENLSMAKRQVVNDGVIRRVEDLRDSLKKIEQTEHNQRMTDLRSTLILVKTFVWCILSIAALAFCMEVYNGLYSTTGAVADEMITEAVDWAFGKISI